MSETRDVTGKEQRNEWFWPIYGGTICYTATSKEKTLHLRQERTEFNALSILEKTANDPTKLTASDLTILLTWHQQPKVASMKKVAKLNAWLRITEQN